jgi:hypothetical protein
MQSVRILLLGPSSVGKSTFLHGFCRSNASETKDFHRTLTINTDILEYFYKNRNYAIEFVELGSNPEYENVYPFFYRDCDGVIAMFDASSSSSHGVAFVSEVLSKVASALSSSTSTSRDSRKHMNEFDFESQNQSDGFLPTSSLGGDSMHDSSSAGQSQGLGMRGSSTRRRMGASASSLSSKASKPHPSLSPPLHEGTDAPSLQNRAKKLLQELPVYLLANKSDLISISRSSANATFLNAALTPWRSVPVGSDSHLKIEVVIPPIEQPTNDKSTMKEWVQLLQSSCPCVSRKRGFRFTVECPLGTASSTSRIFPMTSLTDFIERVLENCYGNA